MAWLDNLIEAAYTSPSGERLTFQYEDVSKEFDKKTSGYDFPDADGTYVQDTGSTSDRFPFRIFFWGAEYDTEAEAFEAALRERGVGKLEHPIYGVRDVVPFGAIKRRDDLKTAANQTILQLTFWETTGLVYPSSAGDPASEVVEAVDEYNAAAAAELELGLFLRTVTAAVTFGNNVEALVSEVTDGLQTIADVADDVQKQFNAIVDSINTGIDFLVKAPLALAFQITQMIQAPARALASIKARLSAYGDLAQSLISGNGASVGSSGGELNVSNENELRTNDLFVSSYVTGSIVSVVNNQFVTKTEALEAADTILQQFADVVAWRDDNFEALGVIDTGGSYQKLQEAVAITVGFLVEISFSLKQERSIVLDRPRTYIDLCAELYGKTDSEFDFMITSNDLSGDEMLELPAGKEIVYYV